MAPSSLLDIPPEIISYILSYLPFRDIVTCKLTCRTLNRLTCDSVLRYLVQLERSGVNDDLGPGLPYSERLATLQRREDAWAMLDFRRTVRAVVPFDSTGIYDFTGGAFLLGTRLYHTSRRPTVGYSYVLLPSLGGAPDEQLRWIGHSLGTQILDVGLAVHEHDLIAALTAKADTGYAADRLLTLEIQLLSFSTGQPHPLAEHANIFIGNKSLLLGHCNVLIEIVGEYLALLITFPWAREEDEDMFFLVHWKKGKAHFLQSPKWGAYAYFSFLSEDTFVIPNLIQNTLEIVQIVLDGAGDDDGEPTPRLAPLCTLNLPPLTQHAAIIRLGCRAEPNPIGNGALALPAPLRRPFRDAPRDAIVVFNLLVEDAHLHGQFHFPETRPFTFIVHRSALLALAHGGARELPWATWGPAVTRWFESDPAALRWITTTAGQRAVVMEDAHKTSIIVRDFNPYAVRAARARWSAQAGGAVVEEERLPNGNMLRIVDRESVLARGSVFKEDVRSALAYVEVRTREKYEYEGVLIDEERILGLKTNQEDGIGISSFDVHILG